MDIPDIVHELLTFFLGPLPGALGLVLRKACYPWLFRNIGRAVIFGRSVIVRNPRRIILGDRVVIDDYVVLDGGREGLRIGDGATINRGVVIHAKAGPIRIGPGCNIGAETTIISRGVNIIETKVSIGGGCKIGGIDCNDLLVRGSKAGIRIGAKSVLEEKVAVLDGATIGSECIIGASAVIRGRIPDRLVVAPEERLVIMPRATFIRPTAAVAERAQITGASCAREPEGQDESGSSNDPRVMAVVLRAIAELNGMLPDGSRLREHTSSPIVQPDGPLDSLGVVNLLVAVEDEAELEFGRRPNLTEMGTRPEDSSVLSTVGALAKFVAERLKN